MTDKNTTDLQLARIIVKMALNRLRSNGVLRPCSRYRTYNISIDDRKLEEVGLIGATTIGIDSLPIIYLRSFLSFDLLIGIVAHESVHLAQILNGDLVPGIPGFKNWRGTWFVTFPATSHFYSEQPWEREAFDLAPELESYIRKKTNMIVNAGSGTTR